MKYPAAVRPEKLQKNHHNPAVAPSADRSRCAGLNGHDRSWHASYFAHISGLNDEDPQIPGFFSCWFSTQPKLYQAIAFGICDCSSWFIHFRLTISCPIAAQFHGWYFNFLVLSIVWTATCNATWQRVLVEIETYQDSCIIVTTIPCEALMYQCFDIR